MHARSWRRGDDALPPIVLVHGFVISGAYMVPIGDRLASHTTVHAPDLPGFGRSEGPRRALGVSGLADSLRAWMRAADVTRPVLLGNSFGCQVVAHLAANDPDAVSGVVLTGPTLDPDARSLRGVVPRLAREQRTHSRDMRRTMLRSYAQAGPRRIIGTARHALRDRIEQHLPQVHAPTLVVRGTRDPLVPTRWAEEVVGLLPDARLQEIDGGVHALVHENPDALADAILPFLTHHPTRDRSDHRSSDHHLR